MASRRLTRRPELTTIGAVFVGEILEYPESRASIPRSFCPVGTFGGGGMGIRMTDPELLFKKWKRNQTRQGKTMFHLRIRCGRKDSAGRRTFHVDPIKLLMDERDLL